MNPIEAVQQPGGGQLYRLPDRPVVTIALSRRAPIDLRGLWSYRELLYFLIWRDVKVRYKQTALGAVWVVMQPALATALFVLLFGRLIGVGSDGLPYTLFAFAGMAPWMFFSGAVTNSSNSLVTNSNLIAKVYFPRVFIPAAAIGARLPDFAITLLVLAALMVYHGVQATWALLMLPLLVLLTVLLALGSGLLLSALNVRYRDVGALVPFLIQISMFATPIIYPLSLVPDKWRWVLLLNPLSGMIEGYRAALFGKSIDWPSLLVSAATTVVLLFISALVFRRMERRFADVV